MSMVYVVSMHSDNEKLYGALGERMLRPFTEEEAAFRYAYQIMQNGNSSESVYVETFNGVTGEFIDHYREYAIEKYVETLHNDTASQSSTIVDSAESNTDTVAKTSTCSDCVSYVSMCGSPYCRLYGRSVSDTETCNFKVLKG